MILTIAIFLVILASLVFVHELGHFLAAKISGVRVDEFALGFPPRIFSKKVGETLYSIGCLPLGGYVKIFGEDGAEMVIDFPEKTVASRSFSEKPHFIQAFILLAGIIGNIIFGWLLFSIALMSGLTVSAGTAQQSYITNQRVTITDVLPESPAAIAGLTTNETVIAVDGTQISNIADIQEKIKDSLGKPVSLETKSTDSTEKNIILTPEKNIIADGYGIGIAMDTVGEAHLPLYLALYDGAKVTWTTIEDIVSGFGEIITDAFRGQSDFGAVSGPVGIARLVGQAEKVGFAYLISFAAFISINLAIINLVPFPALDGGRILFVLIETVRRKNISAKVTNTVNSIGFGILMFFIIVVTIKDVIGIWK